MTERSLRKLGAACGSFCVVLEIAGLGIAAISSPKLVEATLGSSGDGDRAGLREPRDHGGLGRAVPAGSRLPLVRRLRRPSVGYLAARRGRHRMGLERRTRGRSTIRRHIAPGARVLERAGLPGRLRCRRPGRQAAHGPARRHLLSQLGRTSAVPGRNGGRGAGNARTAPLARLELGGYLRGIARRGGDADRRLCRDTRVPLPGLGRGG